MRTCLLVVATLPLALAACGDSEAGGNATARGAAAVLRFTAIPGEKAQDLRARFDPVAEYLTEQLGIEVAYVPSPDYPASVEMFRNGDVHLAWFGGVTGLQARAAVPGARAIVQGAEDLTFRSYFVANASTGIERSDEFPMALEGRSFTFGSQDSTSGRLMPEHFVRQHTGKAPSEFFAGNPGFSGSHDLTAQQVQAGRVEAGALNYVRYDALVQEGKIDPEVCRVVWETPPYADYNMTAHPDIDAVFGAGTIDRIQQALTGLDDERLLASFQRSALVPASNDDFAELRPIAESLGLLR